MSLKGKVKEISNKVFGCTEVPNQNQGATIIKEKVTIEEEKKLLDSIRHFGKDGTSPVAEAMSNHFTAMWNISLESKIENYIKWFKNNSLMSGMLNISDFIEKMAVWYELRYPDYEISKLIPFSGQENKNINNEMFNKNCYIDVLLDENSETRQLDWGEFYNAKAFINSLPIDERRLFYKTRYSALMYLNPAERKAHLHLNNGIVTLAEGINVYTKGTIKDEKLQGMHVKNVIKYFKDKGIELPSNNELEESVRIADQWKYQKEEMLNCVMYRIIERGGKGIGPRRALLFAKDFNRNIDIPMQYGIDSRDDELRSFINEYIKLGGSKDLVCFVNYFDRSINKKIEIVTIKEILKKSTTYTEEETKLYQRMVNALAGHIDHDELKREQSNQLRLQRKLEKSKINK